MGPLFLEGWRESPINGIAMIIGFYLTFIFPELNDFVILNLIGITFIKGQRKNRYPCHQ